ncbi:MAG: hypothetical protein A3E51_00015 [Burkholderiales bacterium RIFCSPHIGHO2_12_FULL_67_38]|nr:MAG: hypothetical protein A3I64_03365 [Burkholderiales bacterium RIFCSPLOWO2_02_FULL_67_64]OGB36826.1 MAG: hypothetical protein A3E51_00015 [Burkholderiales bacterium RIFCSPHIGHO2_12_FULL_67_38]OGB93454.1 MAG: hypothetical protein A3G82_19870 [Burkholderiales bacterium RIFCSPLOWO2_12_FULL_67_210]
MFKEPLGGVCPPAVRRPSVPQVLRDALKDHPSLIAELQQALNPIELAPTMNKRQRFDLFERATLSLEGRLETFVARAQAELLAANAAGDGVAAARARDRKALLLRCRGEGHPELIGFFDLRTLPPDTVDLRASVAPG